MADTFKMPVRSKEITLNGDWTGFKFTAKTNPTMGSLEDMMSGNYSQMRQALAEIILTWNFPDEQGQPLPDPAAIRQKTYEKKKGEPLGYEETQAKRNDELLSLMKRVPVDLAIAMAKELNKAVWEIPPN
jgi:hypothetical protein